MTGNWGHWRHLGDRYRKSEHGPHRMLALDGGGIRGLITLKVLVRLEKLLAQRYAKDDFRLCEFFDYVAGTSTGAIIAAGIARGMSADEILQFYREFGKIAFTKRPWYQRLKSFYENGELERKLKEVFGTDTTLEPQHLYTLLLIVTRNVTTDSAWPISSNPDARYNDADRSDNNLKLPLWQLVRASTAAPVYFPPEVIHLHSRSFVFVDGGTTSYNNPAFCMYRMATEPAYRLNWQRGEDNLLIVSIGTGLIPAFGTEADNPEDNLLSNMARTLSGLMSQAAVDQDVNCRTIGRCMHGHHLDNELGQLLADRDDDNPRSFLYARYNVDLTEPGLASIGLSDIAPKDVATLDSVDAMGDLERIGDELARQLELDHFGKFINDPLGAKT